MPSFQISYISGNYRVVMVTITSDSGVVSKLYFNFAENTFSAEKWWNMNLRGSFTTQVYFAFAAKFYLFEMTLRTYQMETFEISCVEEIPSDCLKKLRLQTEAHLQVFKTCVEKTEGTDPRHQKHIDLIDHFGARHGFGSTDEYLQFLQ